MHKIFWVQDGFESYSLCIRKNAVTSFSIYNGALILDGGSCTTEYIIMTEQRKVFQDWLIDTSQQRTGDEPKG